MDGKPVQVTWFDDDRKLELNEEALTDILESDDCRDNPVCVVSINGTCRLGKSFLLNFFLRYLVNRGYEGNDWIGDRNDSLQRRTISGFESRDGDDGVTDGIVMWSKAFVVPIVYTATDSSPGFTKKIAVILMDTQGTHDGKLADQEIARLFSLSGLTSSIMLLNVSKQITVADLMFLELFAEFGAHVMEQQGTSAFDDVMFVVRDYQNFRRHPFGLTGGDAYVQHKLTGNDGDDVSFAQMRRNIRSLFRDPMKGCLFPYPGNEVVYSGDQTFSNIHSDDFAPFLRVVKELVPSILSPDNLPTKRLNGEELTGAEILERFKNFRDSLNSGSIPQLASRLLTANAPMHLQKIVARISHETHQKIIDVIGTGKEYLSTEELEDKLDAIFKEGVEKYNSLPKFGDEETIIMYRDILVRELEIAEDGGLKINANKSRWWKHGIRETLKRHGKALAVASVPSTVSGVGAASIALRTELMLAPFVGLTAGLALPITLVVSGIATISTIGYFHFSALRKYKQERENRRVQQRRLVLETSPTATSSMTHSNSGDEQEPSSTNATDSIMGEDMGEESGQPDSSN